MAGKSKGLGRGLDALLTSNRTVAPNTDSQSQILNLASLLMVTYAIYQLIVCNPENISLVKICHPML